jgi:hypothetical protein
VVVPHNSNWSNGTLFAGSYLVDQGKGVGLDEKQLLALRARLEPVAEIAQHKGDMECSPGLREDWTADPQCTFEKIRTPPFEDCGEGTGSGGVKEVGCVSRLDFLRGFLAQRLGDGQRFNQLFPLGVIGSTDSHNGTPGNTDEASWPGHVGTVDDTPEERLGPGNSTHRGLNSNPGGLAAVWAFERSRDAIFEALLRRETYSTSGTRIAVRLFAGWELPDGLCQASDRVEQGYRKGVPMGGRLGARPSGAALRLLVEATADPGTASRPGTPLQQVQIIKAWLDASGQAREKVVTVADAGGTAGVDAETCKTSGGGASSLCAEWTDPELDPQRPAFYYARVLENPTCRWSTRDCNAVPLAGRPAVCSDPKVPKVIQERAITSAIWYTP